MNKLLKNILDNCPVCESKNIVFHSNFRGNNNIFNNTSKFICQNCDLVFCSPMPNNQALESYNSSYHQNAHGGHERDSKLDAFFTGIAKCRLYTLETKINLRKDQFFKVLEIGPGPGVFAREWLNKYQNTEYHVLETDTSVHDILHNLGIKIIESSNLELNQSSYDLVVISHVLEHVNKPITFLSKFVRALKKGGYMFIEVPCRDWEHKEMDEPHLLFFEKKSFIKLIEMMHLEKVFIGYFGTKIKNLKNPIFKFYYDLKQKLFYRNINIYNNERKNLNKILKSKLETNAVINYSPHIEQNEPSWWLRTIIKK